MIWGGVISAVADIAGGYLKGKQEKAQAKQKLEVAKIEAQMQKVTQDGTGKRLQLRQAIIRGKTSLDCLLCPTHRCLFRTCRATIHRRWVQVPT